MRGTNLPFTFATVGLGWLQVMVTRCPASVAIEPKHEITTKYYVYTNEYDNKFAYYWFLAIVLKDTTEIEPVSAIYCNRVIYY